MQNNRTLWVVVLVALLLLCCCAAISATLLGFLVAGGIGWGASQLESLAVEASAPFDRSLNVEGPVSLRVNAPVGRVTVRASDGDRVEVEATRRAWGGNQAAAEARLDQIGIDVEQEGDTVYIEVNGLDESGSGPRSPEVDLVITVPEQTSVGVVSRVGQIVLTGTRGDVELRTDVGEILIEDVEPVERLRATTRVANIEMESALVPGARYEFSTDAGRVALRLPAESAFEIDARSEIGEVAIGFPMEGRREREGIAGEHVEGIVGEEPRASIEVRSTLGEITVQPRP